MVKKIIMLHLDDNQTDRNDPNNPNRRRQNTDTGMDEDTDMTGDEGTI